MNAPNISDDDPIFSVLRRNGVPFVVIDGHAVYRHGYLRTTEDYDLVWLRSPQSAASLLDALTELQAVWIGKEVDPSTGIERTYPVTAAFIHAEHLMMLWTPHGPLDLFDYIPDIPNEDVQELFETAVIGDGIRFSSLAWLKRMKLAAGRTKDLADIEELDKRNPG